MCGRYVVYQTGELKSRFKVPDDEENELLEDLRANYNVAPAQNMPVVTQDDKRHLKLMRWGLIPGWSKDEKIGYKLINARAETIFEKPMWKNAALKYRCLVPANGFYEWKAEADGKHPFFIHPKDQELFSFAGLCSKWTDKATGEVVDSYSIITTTPNKEMESIHNRMPVILKANQEDDWLEPTHSDEDLLKEFLRPYGDGKLEMVEVGRDVNSVKNNEKKLIYPIDANQ